MIGRLLKARYELVGLIHDGPIFATYAARDKIQGRELTARVIKPPFAAETGFVDRLVATVQKYSVVQSANIERLHSVESDDGLPFILGDLTRGPSLSDRIKKLAPFSVPVSVGTILSTLQALDSVHRSGLVHGDLNPQHLAVMADGDVRLQLTGVWEAYSASPTAGVMVLPAMAPYLAPEVSQGAMPSPRSDVYALGVVLYELIAGRLPYHGETPLSMALQHSTAATPSVRAANMATPTVLDEIVKKAMAKDPDQRYANAGEMIVDLRMLQDALRFGRSLTWPLRPESVQPGPGPTGKGPVSRPQPVAPRMSAIRKEQEPVPPSKKQRQDRDIPLWMLIPFVVLVAICLTIGGLWFAVNLGQHRWVTVPNIKTLSVTEASSLLRESKLTLKVGSREANDKVQQDGIIDTSPEPGEKIREGGQISVIVSSGKKNVEIPPLKGLTLDKAKETLANLNLSLGDTAQNVSDPKVARGLIVRTDPAENTSVERGSQVKVYISTGPSEETTSSQPDNQGGDKTKGYLYTLHLKLKDLVHKTNVRIDMQDEDGTRTIYQHLHDSGDRFSVAVHGKQKTATFTIYYDDTLMMTKQKNAEGDETSEETIEPDGTSGTTGE